MDVYVFVTDPVKTFCPVVSSVMSHQTITPHVRQQEVKPFKQCLFTLVVTSLFSHPAEFSDFNSLNVPPHNRRHQVGEKTKAVCCFVYHMLTFLAPATPV